MNQIDNKRLSAKSILETLRNRICLLEYPPGTILRESDLAKEFGISRTPIRGVLQQLAHSGLIKSKDGVGTIVTDLSFDEIRDIYQMRIQLAQCIGHMNPRAFTQADSEAMYALQTRARLLTKKFDLVEYWMINHDQHFLIGGIIGNAALREMWDHFYFLAARMYYKHVQSHSVDLAVSLVCELSEVLRAINENNPIALGYIQSNYIAYGLAYLEKENL